MSVKINFDINNLPENPTLILAHRNGDKIDKIVSENIIVRDSMINPAEITFRVRKFLNGKENILWDKIVDFKLVWYKEADLWFEIYVDIDESNETIKNVSCTQLGQAELSQIMLFDIEINTENDIARDDYEIPTVLYNPEHQEASLIHRIGEKAEHYTILHVDDSIKNIQRTFTFNDTSIIDAHKKIAEEIGCLFVYHSDSDENGKLRRVYSVYDLESNCKSCGYRGEFTTTCPECNSSNINEGYGNDTTIFITPDELAEDIQFTTDTGSVKNCFKLEAGDDLMTATIRNCNPNGTDYIWYISDNMKTDMSKELVDKIESYDALYNAYQNDYIVNISSSTLTEYNNLVKRYQAYNKDLQLLSSSIKGYPALMTALYNTIDLSLFLESALMPDVTMADTNAEKQAALLTNGNLSPVAVTDVSSISLATANSAVLSMAKIVIDSRYQVKVNNSSISNQTWTGNFIVTNYSDEEDTATSSVISVQINDDYEYFVRQKVNKAIKEKEKETEDLSITGLFKLDYNSFCEELKKYSLNRLTSFYDACQSCIDILIEQGVADSATWSGSDSNLYDNLYMPYYQKLKAIENELKIRQSEIDLINGVYDSDGSLIQSGLQSRLNDTKKEIQKQLDFQNYIGDELWLEFCSYRREDKYSNENYISDGLNNSELFEKALEFIKVAKNEIYKSAELQHSISSSLKNLLVMEKFKSLINYFETGNWIRIIVNDNIYKLRLLEYEIDFSNIDSLSVDFSDVLKTANGESDQKSIISKVASMTSSYNSVQKQATQGSKGNEILNTWFSNGLDTTLTKIVSGADNQSQTWDSHGMLFRKYNPIIDSYDDTQLKIVNSTIAITNDNWKSTKTAVGAYYYFHPETNKLTMAYGINAEVLVGKLILGEQLGIYNESGSMSFNNNGFLITNGVNSFRVNPNSKVLLAISNKDKDVFYIDNNGELHISGDGSGLDVSTNSDITNMKSKIIANEENISAEITRATGAEGKLSTRIKATEEGLATKVSAGDIVSTINQTAKEVLINASKIKFEGLVTANNYFKISEDGSIEATNATISGNITADDGQIGGWNITSGSLYSGSGTNHVQLSTDDLTYAIWAGAEDSSNAPFRLGKNGNLIATNADINGKITADDGQIGGWTIGTGSLYAGNDKNRVQLSTSDPTYAIWAGSEDSSDAPFRLGKNGDLVASNADINGKITANEGQIGGWTIGTDSLYATGLDEDEDENNENDEKYVSLSTGDPTYAIWAGAKLSDNAPFRVARDGTVYLTKLYVTDENGVAQSKPINLRTSYWKMDAAYSRSVQTLSVEGNTLTIGLYDGTSVNFKKAATGTLVGSGNGSDNLTVSYIEEYNGPDTGTTIASGVVKLRLNSDTYSAASSVIASFDGKDYGNIHVGCVYTSGKNDGMLEYKPSSVSVSGTVSGSSDYVLSVSATNVYGNAITTFNNISFDARDAYYNGQDDVKNAITLSQGSWYSGSKMVSAYYGDSERLDSITVSIPEISITWSRGPTNGYAMVTVTCGGKTTTSVNSILSYV